MQAKEEYSTPAERSDVQENIKYVPAKSAAIRKRYRIEIIIFGTSSNPSKSATHSHATTSGRARGAAAPPF